MTGERAQRQLPSVYVKASFVARGDRGPSWENSEMHSAASLGDFMNAVQADARARFRSCISRTRFKKKAESLGFGQLGEKGGGGG